MATKAKAKNFDFDKSYKVVKEKAKNINDFVLETSDDMIDVAIKRGAEWQKVGDKAIKGGLKLAANQQDIFFNTLEMFKSQLMEGNKRFRGLFSKN